MKARKGFIRVYMLKGADRRVELFVNPRSVTCFAEGSVNGRPVTYVGINGVSYTIDMPTEEFHALLKEYD